VKVKGLVSLKEKYRTSTRKKKVSPCVCQVGEGGSGVCWC